MELRHYQREVARAVIASIEDSLGLTFTVEIARQGGKNELSAHLQVLLLTMFISRGGSGIKCSPTFKPQTLISMARLKERLDEYGYGGIWDTEAGYIVRLGNARWVFLSADETSSVVGHTAEILLEVDEAQDVSREKYTRDFRPMASAHNTTTVLYGTTWDDSTLLEEVKQLNLELEGKDGIRRHFRYDWQEVAKYNPSYLKFVEAERERLGEEHPLFRTQYALLPISGGGGFLSPLQLAALKGEHPRRRFPDAGRTYVAGIDFAGEAEQPEAERLVRKSRDATVVTIAEVAAPSTDEGFKQPLIKVVEHYARVGARHADLLAELVGLLKDVWRVERVVCDATGVGEPLASLLKSALGSRVLPFKFTRKTKSELAFDLLAAVNSGRLKVYRQDGSEDHSELMDQLYRARQLYHPDRTLDFFVPAAEGHDDYLMSLALVVQAVEKHTPRKAQGMVRS